MKKQEPKVIDKGTILICPHCGKPVIIMRDVNYIKKKIKEFFP